MSEWTPLGVEDCAEDPFAQFATWFDEAEGHMAERQAICLATSTTDGHPSARMVLLRYIDDRSFGWYTNYGSRKGADLEVNPFAALLWYNEAHGRQVRVEGVVERMGEPESDAYFNSRARGHQIGAHASRQSEPLDSRKELEDRVSELEVQFAGELVPRPACWGGYRLTPTSFEFWQHREDRLHDRVRYLRVDGSSSPTSGPWSRRRLSP
ncbi:MAG: pyridoxamine 5'-phosphate oxidase [Acidimicrobiales bacterium]